MSGQKCNYFERNREDPFKIEVIGGAVYCACADISSGNGSDIARKVCEHQIGGGEREFFQGLTYWRCRQSEEILANFDGTPSRKKMPTVRDYYNSIRKHLGPLGLNS